MMQVYFSNLQGARNYRTEKNKYRTGSESARNRGPEEYESTVFYRTFLLLILFYSIILAPPVTICICIYTYIYIY